MGVWRNLRDRTVRAMLLLLLTGAALALAAPEAWAQEDVIYTTDQLTTLPTLASPGQARALIDGSYPANLRSAGVTGRVQVQFVVAPDGTVEPGSVEVIAATAAAFADAARSIVPKLKFRPGRKNGTAVRTRVVLPITYGQD